MDRMSNLRIRDPDGIGYGDGDRRKTSGGSNEERLEARVLELLGDKKAAIEACHRAEKEVRELNKIIQKRDDEIQDLRRGSKYNFSSNDEQIQKLRQQIDERDNIIMELESKLSAKEAEIDQLKNNNGDGTKRRSESSEVIKLQRRVISLQERLEESEKQNRNVDRGDGSSVKILQTQLKAAEEARVMAERRLATAERSLLDKEDEIKSADRNIKKLRKDLEEKESRLQSLVEQMGESRSQNSSTTYLRAQLDAANDTIKRLRDEMTERVRTLGSSNNNYMEEIEAKDAEISALTTRWKKALSESESLKDEVSSLNSRLKDLQIELDKTLEDNANMSHTIEDLKIDLQQARNESYSFERRSSSFTSNGTPTKTKSRSISPNGADVTSRMRDRIQDLEETLLAKSEELEEAREEQLRVQRELEIMRSRENEERDDESIRRSVGRYPAQEVSRMQRSKSSNSGNTFPRRISESRGDPRREIGGTVNRRYVANQQLERALAGVDGTSKRRSNSAGRSPETGDILLNTYPMNDPDHPAFSSAIRRSSSKNEFQGSMTRSRTGNASPVTGSIRMRSGSGNTITAPVRVYDLTESDTRSTSRNRQPYSFKEADDDPLTRTYPYAKHTAYEEISIRGRPNGVDDYSNPARRGRSTDKYDGNSKIRSRSGEMIDEVTGTRARSRSRGRGDEDVLLLTYPAAASRHPVWDKDGDDLRSQLDAAKRETARLRRELEGR